MSNEPTVWPSLMYPDADAARRFLTEVLGFTETLTVRDDAGETIVHGELRWPEGGGVMYGTVGNGHATAPEPPVGGQWIYVVTDDPDAVYQRALDAGATIVDKPHDTDYGSRNVTVADPADNHWVFGTYRGA